MSTERWMDKEIVVHMHYGILLSYKKEHIWVSYNEWNKLEPGIQNEISQKEKDKYCILTHIYYIWNLERWYQWSYMQGSKGDTDVKKQTFGLSGKRWGWDDLRG